MCPVFTAFTSDKKHVNYDIIDNYAQLLKQKGITGILVNGTTGEGMCLRVEERKRLAEEWLKVCRKYNIVCMVQIGGTTVADVYDLAEHAEKIGVDAVLCLPELFFKPTCEEDLVYYLKEVARYCPTRPLFYYHIPIFTKVYLTMSRLCDIAEREISTFCGIKYTSGDLIDGTNCLKEGRNVILGADSVLSGALILGFDAAILTTLNICPEYALECYDYIQKGKINEARTAQDKLNRRIGDILSRGSGDWVETMKDEFNRTNGKLNAGPFRKPSLNILKKH